MRQIHITNREDYKKRQIAASKDKFQYCKFSHLDAEKYIGIIRRYEECRRLNPSQLGPILSLGTRNGREVNCFRITLNRSRLYRRVTLLLERRRYGFSSYFPFLENYGVDDVNDLTTNSSIGVEINPRARRRDIWIGSFDELPYSWNHQFKIIYTNAFDHSMDAKSTAESMTRCLQEGGYIILCFPESQEPTDLDPVGHLTLLDALNLFPGELIYYSFRGSEWNYSEYIIRIG